MFSGCLIRTSPALWTCAASTCVPAEVTAAVDWMTPLSLLNRVPLVTFRVANHASCPGPERYKSIVPVLSNPSTIVRTELALVVVPKPVLPRRPRQGAHGGEVRAASREGGDQSTREPGAQEVAACRHPVIIQRNNRGLWRRLGRSASQPSPPRLEP